MPEEMSVLRERIATLEVEVKHLRLETVQMKYDLGNDIKELTVALKDFQSLLGQAQGGKKMLIGLVSVGAIFAGVVSNWTYILAWLKGG